MTYPSPYHVTTPLSPQQLAQAVQTAKRQEDFILALYRSLCRAMTPSEIHAHTTRLGKEWPLTSCRRAITGLEHDGLLVKTDVTVIGPYGKPQYRWRLP